MPTPAASPDFRLRLRGRGPAGAAFVEGGVTAPGGFRASAAAAGIRRSGLDLAVLASERPCQVAGVFTQNLVCAAPVRLCRELLYGASPQTSVRAIVVNSGNANACTGAPGDVAAASMASATEGGLGLPERSCLVASTGVIGQPLPVDKVLIGIKEACANLSAQGGRAAARAIMTTDTVPKEVALNVPLAAGTITIGAMCKGSGMIHPNMATLLGFITTDAKLDVDHEQLQQLLRHISDTSFNSLTIDGDTSTNDSLFFLANGASGVAIGPGTADWSAFVEALLCVAQHLAILMAGDGEGATKLLEVVVKGASDGVSLRQVAFAVAKSSLVKTAIFGEDANWGRVLAAVGYAGVSLVPHEVSIFLGGLPVCAGGVALPFDEGEAKRILESDWVTVTVVLGGGSETATVWGCDLSCDYVKINGSYRT